MRQYTSFVYQIIIFCFLISGCETKNFVHIDENCTSTVELPAEFIVKVSGITNYEKKEKKVPVGKILTEKVEKNLKRLKVLADTVPDSHKHRYILGITVDEYEPGGILEIFTAPHIYTRCSIHLIEKDENNEEKIGQSIADFPAYGLIRNSFDLILDPGQIVIQDCANIISETLEDAFLD